MQIINQTIHGGTQQFADAITNDENISTTITGSTVHGSVVTAETIDNSRHQSFDGTASNANINFGDNAALTNTVQPLDNQGEKHTSH